MPQGLTSFPEILTQKFKPIFSRKSSVFSCYAITTKSN